MKRTFVSIFWLMTLVATPLQAERWFEIEVVLFKHLDVPEDLRESFGSVPSPVLNKNHQDLLSPWLYPRLDTIKQLLPNCDVPPPAATVDPMPLVNWESLAMAIAEHDRLKELEKQDGFAFDEFDNMATEADSVVEQAEYHSQDNERDLPRLYPDVALDDYRIQMVENKPQTPEFYSIPTSLGCDALKEDNYLSNSYEDVNTLFVEQTPVQLDGRGKYDSSSPYLLKYSDLKLNDIYSNLRRSPGVRPMLHMGWRQPVPVEDDAPPYRLFAGQNFAKQYNVLGFPEVQDNELIENEELKDDSDPLDDLLSLVENASNEAYDVPFKKRTEEDLYNQLPENALVQDVWELDGLMRVYLKLVGQVFYLHIDTQLNFRMPQQWPSDVAKPDRLEGQQVQFLSSIPFDQLRRVISTETHYFDHPYFGMIVQIRRHTPQN